VALNLLANVERNAMTKIVSRIIDILANRFCF